MGLNFEAKIRKNRTDFFFQTKILAVFTLYRKFAA